MNRWIACLVLILALVSCAKDEPVSPDNHDYHLKPVGTSAGDLLRSSAFTSLHIELVYVDGYAPNTTAVTNLKSFLNQRLNKPDGITVSQSAISSPQLAPYSVDDVIKMETDFRTGFNQEKKLEVFVFIADGNYAGNDNVLGFAYRNTSICLFGAKIHSLSGGIGQPGRSLLETTVLNHEFGHLMGLVNLGTPLLTGHQDTANGNHCDVSDCLMYWATESGDVVANLAGLSEPPGLDAQCIADLQANGGK